MLVFMKEDYNIRFLKNINKIVFPSMFSLCFVLMLIAYSSNGDIKTLFKSELDDTSLNANEDNSSYEHTEYDSTDIEGTDFTASTPEEVTLYTGQHIGGADIIAGSYIASTTSSDGGNLFVYDDSHFLAYHEFYESGYSENKEGSPVYIEDGSEIKITGVSSVTFTPVGN